MFQERVLHFYYDIFILDEILQEHFIKLEVLIGMTTFFETFISFKNVNIKIEWVGCLILLSRQARHSFA